MTKRALVAGATRGAGRGIARALGEAGYEVVCTGRSTAAAPSPYAMPETIDQTAALIGRQARAVVVDHADAAAVAALFAEHGPFDVVVDSVAGDDPAFGGWSGLIESPVENAAAVLGRTLAPRLITARHAAAALRASRGGLLVEVVEFDLPFGAGGNLLSATVKACLKAVAAMLAEELRAHGVTAVSVTPGFLRSEVVLRHFGVTAATWREGIAKDPHFAFSESPLFIGRGIVALAADAGRHERTGDILSSWELAREYGVVDEDGTRPDWGEHWRTGVLPTMPELRDGIAHHAVWLERAAARARAQVAER